MYSRTKDSAIIKDFNPESIASCPRDGPTIASSIILAGAGNLPDFKILDKSLASLILKLPEIWDLPPEISDWTVGKE